jgi:hypothetical protein
MKNKFTLLSILLCAFQSYAVVVYKPLCENDKKAEDFTYVGGIQNILTGGAGSAVIIGEGQYLITARHCLTLSGTVEGQVVCAEALIYFDNQNSYHVSEVYASEKADLAICKLNVKLKSYAKIIPELLVDDEFYGVGLGKSSSQINFEKMDFDLPYGTKRVFKNNVLGQMMKQRCFDNSEKSYLLHFYMMRNENSPFGEPILGEGMHGPGDSGGGMFTYYNGELCLFAIICSTYYEKPLTGFGVDLFTNLDWIEKIVPNACSQVTMHKNKSDIERASRFVRLLNNDIPYAIQSRRRKKVIEFTE